jgi:hypothetical protein
LIGRWPLGEVGAKLDARESSLNYLEIVGNVGTAAEFPGRSLDPDFTDWDPDDMDTWDERIVLVADDEDFLDWRRDWLTEKTVAAEPYGSEALCATTLANRVHVSVPGRMVR